jgi:hypothetical protein
MCYNNTYLLTTWSKVLLEKLTGFQLVKKYPAFMEPEGLLSHSEVSTTCPYPEPARSSPSPHIPLPEDHLLQQQQQQQQQQQHLLSNMHGRVSQL